MACEDFPCCGHDICPRFDQDGKQLNMVCVCGADVSVDSPYSLCRGCMREAESEWEIWSDEREYDFEGGYHSHFDES